MTPTNSNKPALAQAMDRLSREVRDGLRHGFFELTVACEIVKGGKRGLTIKAGKNHRFTIPEEEIE
ncbi:MAG: hypothetical protein QF705_03240 [Arenicellales bacterium]|nr:hypothetical protein [Arenicellales bacterium]MDP7155533.1 hypothetical protein [Arenicellales bacterium]MDP7284411.1 hypothetical protein [Arenicellales bacterium]MDP7481755.1 hypothetical protein [Arenicellales bacterium]